MSATGCFFSSIKASPFPSHIEPQSSGSRNSCPHYDYHHKMPISDPESGLGNIQFTELHLMIPRLQIYLRKVTSSLQLIKKIINPREWVLILHIHLIEFPVINAHQHRTILLLHKENWRSTGRGTRSNKPPL